MFLFNGPECMHIMWKDENEQNIFVAHQTNVHRQLKLLTVVTVNSM